MMRTEFTGISKRLFKITPIAAMALGATACTTVSTQYSAPMVGDNCIVSRTATFKSEVQTETLGFDSACAEASKISNLYGSGDARLASIVAAAQFDLYEDYDPAFAQTVYAQVSREVPNFDAMLQQGRYNLEALSPSDQAEQRQNAQDNVRGVYVIGDPNTTTFVLPEAGAAGGPQ